MKKVVTILIALSFLMSFTGCDFLRKVAGRPTESQVNVLAQKVRKAENAKIARLAEQEREKQIQDSLAKVEKMFTEEQIGKKYNVRFAKSFRFGKPSSPNLKKYDIIIGVYRYANTVAEQIKAIKARGYAPFEITFPGGEYAVSLASFDDLASLDAFLTEVRPKKSVCPENAWIYVQE